VALSRAGALVLLLACACAHRPATVVFMTDFGLTDDSVAICKGVMLSVEPALRIVDLTHDVRPFAIADGARFLADTALYYPAGTVFAVVVDPGVGTTRRAIVARSGRGQRFVLPDNGLLTLIEARDGLDGAREITNPAWLRPTSSTTFHGRDVFAPVAAHLAAGADWHDVGPPVGDLVRLSLPAARAGADGLAGEAIALDGPYGNVITDVGVDAVRTLGYRPGDHMRLRLDQRTLALPFVRTFGDVPEGRPLAYIDSRGRLALAVNQGNFAKVYGVTPPVPLFVYPPGSGRE
jgi:S-adenosylmethionine hydrolase